MKVLWNQETENELKIEQEGQGGIVIDMKRLDSLIQSLQEIKKQQQHREKQHANRNMGEKERETLQMILEKYRGKPYAGKYYMDEDFYIPQLLKQYGIEDIEFHLEDDEDSWFFSRDERKILVIPKYQIRIPIRQEHDTLRYKGEEDDYFSYYFEWED